MRSSDLGCGGTPSSRRPARFLRWGSMSRYSLTGQGVRRTSRLLSKEANLVAVGAFALLVAGEAIEREGLAYLGVLLVAGWLFASGHARRRRRRARVFENGSDAPTVRSRSSSCAAGWSSTMSGVMAAQSITWCTPPRLPSSSIGALRDAIVAISPRPIDAQTGRRVATEASARSLR